MKMLGFDLPMEWPWVMPPEPPPPDDFAGKLIILASEGRSIPQAAISLAARMAEKAGADAVSRTMQMRRRWISGMRVIGWVRTETAAEAVPFMRGSLS